MTARAVTQETLLALLGLLLGRGCGRCTLIMAQKLPRLHLQNLSHLVDPVDGCALLATEHIVQLGPRHAGEISKLVYTNALLLDCATQVKGQRESNSTSFHEVDVMPDGDRSKPLSRMKCFFCSFFSRPPSAYAIAAHRARLYGGHSADRHRVYSRVTRFSRRAWISGLSPLTQARRMDGGQRRAHDGRTTHACSSPWSAHTVNTL